MIKVLIIDDQQLVREALKRILAGVRGIQIVGEAAAGKEGIQLGRDLQPDVILLDIDLPDISGLEVARKILRYDRDMKILAVTAKTNDVFPMQLLEMGAHGYLPKGSSAEELEKAIKAVYTGQRYISADIARQLALQKINSHSKKSNFTSLSAREMEVVLFVVKGMAIKDIAKTLNVSPKTVHSYRGRIFDKLKIKSDVELTLMAIKQGLVSVEDIKKQSK